jgi:CBS domain-containing protein
MSARAACRLETLGFERVYRYQPGKADWGAAGLPRVGRSTTLPTAGDAADPTVPTCTLDDDLGELRARVRAAGWDQCLVVNEQRVVLGRLGRRVLAGDERVAVEEAMTPGPSTVRPNARLDELLERLERQGLETALVTTSDGVLVGVVRGDRAGRRPVAGG